MQADHASFSDRFPADRARQLLLHQHQGTSRATYQIDPAPEKMTQCKFSNTLVFLAALSTLCRQAPNRTRKGSHIELRDGARTRKSRKGGGVNMTTIDEHRSDGQIIADLAFAQVQRLRVASLYVLQVHLRPQLGLVHRRTAPDGPNAFRSPHSNHAAVTCMNNAAISTGQRILLRSRPSE